MSENKKIIEAIENSIRLRQEILSNEDMLNKINTIIDIIVNCYKENKKVLFCGNGGSFADCQHLAAELSGRFYFDRPPLEVVLLSSNFSYLTAVSNDYSYEDIFKREILSNGKDGDVLITLSTSGKSKNIINCINSIRKNNIKVISLLGNDGGEIKNISDLNLIIPSNDTARIQECHMMIGHIICEMVEETLFKTKK